MQYAATYGYNWLSDPKGFDEYKRQFLSFHKEAFPILEKILNSNFNPKKVQQFFDTIYKYFIFYSKMDYQFTNTTYLAIDKEKVIAKNLHKLAEFKDIARVWINNVATDDNCCLNRLLVKFSNKFEISIDILNLYKISD